MLEFFDTLTLLLTMAAFIAGIIDSIAGGGGMITIPALLLAGIPPVEALGTNKLQGLFGSSSATIAYARKGHVNIREQWPEAIASLVGSVLGAFLATVLPVDIMRAALPILLIAIAVYFALKPSLGDLDRTRRIGPFLFGMTIIPLIGFYDGLFGPGTGSFFMIAFVALAGFGVLKATAHTKLLNCASNVGGFATFALIGVINWKIGICMGIAQFIGAQIGASLAMKVGSRIIKPLLIVVSLALAMRLLMEPSNPIRQMLGF
ncbi:MULTISPECIES: TSUP family transporter [unclassified Ochrobactrum]|uniref:TSUP family transporter n=1 Tax=unclassified Ochrobactrum TaxID=239106 RepID=UPI0030B0CA11